HKATFLLKDFFIYEALWEDKGKDAQLISWQEKPFTKKGDNFSSYVTSILVNFTQGGVDDQVSYVAKMNPCRGNIGIFNADEEAQLFIKEGKFYLELLKDLNKLLIEHGEERLRFPKCFFANYEKEKQVIIFEDVRTRGFKMSDRMTSMDTKHASLVLKEMGRLHSASVLMKGKYSVDNLLTKYECLKENRTKEHTDLVLGRSFAKGADILAQMNGYDKGIKWVNENKDKLFDIITKSFACLPSFQVVCHGDCWTNNLLFRYDSNDNPVEVILLDVQVCRFASLGSDLNHFMFNSIDADTRKTSINMLFSEYYTSFCKVLQASNEAIPFTLTELTKEYKDKHLYGLVFGTIMIPHMLMSSHDSPDLEKVSKEKIDEIIKKFVQKMFEDVKTNPLWKSRYFGMYDEMIENGVI
ncbi:unnamed protein product, partial [Meganyctiphanes norvegica]